MRGKLAKQLRNLATGINTEGKEVLDKAVYKLFKRQKRTDQPKLENNPRWYSSPVRRAKKTVDGLHFPRLHPTREIGEFFADLDEKGKQSALHLAKIAGTLPKLELKQRVKKLYERIRKDVQPESDQS